MWYSYQSLIASPLLSRDLESFSSSRRPRRIANVHCVRLSGMRRTTAGAAATLNNSLYFVKTQSVYQTAGGKHTFATTRLISMLAKCLLGRRLPRDLLAKDQIFAGEEGCFLALTGFCGVSRTASSSLSTVTSQGAGVLELDAGRSSRLSLTSSWLSRSISTEFVLDSLSCTFDVWPAMLPAER